jgi:hypothetical protein
MRKILIGIFQLTAFSALLTIVPGCSVKHEEIVACGDDQVLIIDKSVSDSTDVTVTWRWKVSEAADLPADYKKLMIPPDECKPVDNNSKILVTSSGGGVVLIDRESKKTIFYAHVPNAHSAELLPGNRIVVALSTADEGNRIELFNINQPDEVIFKDSLYSGHGVVWMPRLERLFSLGYDELRSYSLKDWNSDSPELILENKWKLPDYGGHDLSPISDNSLVLSTQGNVWVFNTDAGQFTPFKLLEEVENVKSVNYNIKTGNLVYTKGEISWWTHNIYCKNPDKTIILPDINLYKVRVIER